MKSLKYLILSSLICGVAMLPSCSNDILEFDDSDLPTIVDGASDIAGGYNVIMLDVDSLPETLLTLGTRKNVDISFDRPESFPIEWVLVTDSENNHHIRIKGLKETGLDLARPQLFNLSIKLRNEAEEKNVRIVLRKKKISSSEIPEDKATFYNTIGASMLPWSNYGVLKTKIIDLEYGELYIQDDVRSAATELGGTRYDEVINNLSTELGMHFKLPEGNAKPSVIFSGGAELGLSTHSRQYNNFEYYIGFIGKIMANASWEKDHLEAMIADSTLYTYLNSYVNDVFNNPDTEGYKKYNNAVEADIDTLLSTYGTHVLAKGSFGGALIHTYGRVENGYETTIGYDVSANLKAQETDGKKAENWADVYQAKNSNYLSGNDSVAGSSSQYLEATHAFQYTLVRGGNGSDYDIEAWENSFQGNPKSWVLVKYCIDSSDGIDVTNCLIPIYEFIVDKDRREAVMNRFAKYIQEHETPREEMNLVLADIRMYAVKDGNHESDANKNMPASFVSTAADGLPYVYYPMSANGNFPDATDVGYGADTAMADFIHAGCEGSHYWYYALGYHELGCYGMTNLTFHGDSWIQDRANQSSILERENWTHTGDKASDVISAPVHNNYVAQLPGSANTPLADKIKAAALYVVPNKSTNAYNQIIASTGGTEWHRGDTATSDYFTYWSGDYGDAKGNTDCEYFYSGALSFANRFRIIFSTKDIPLRARGEIMSFGKDGRKGKIQHPLKWGVTENP